APVELVDRSVLLDAAYFKVERIPLMAKQSSSSLRRGDGVPKLAYLFAAAGAGQIVGAGFDPVELPPRGVVAVPANAPDFVLEDRGDLALIRITPNWPTASIATAS